MIEFQAIVLPAPGIEELRCEARKEGFNFLDRLVEDWQCGENRFDAPGEIFCSCVDDGALVAVGGLNRDQYLNDPGVGRIRRVYVRRAWRNRGIGESLVRSLLDTARTSFRRVRLRAANEGAARLYERIGFVAIDDPNATHNLTFDRAI